MQSGSDDTPKLEDTLDEAEWSWLVPHLERGALIIVQPGNRLIDIAQAVAADAVERIEQWIKTGVVGKPTPENIVTWNQTPTKKFLCVVVQPYVLAQEILLN